MMPAAPVVRPLFQAAVYVPPLPQAAAEQPLLQAAVSAAADVVLKSLGSRRSQCKSLWWQGPPAPEPDPLVSAIVAPELSVASTR
mmetsp:Transcript_35478/g.82819  ORF Transcript_35478/g.82819 Transcript_35478/m.82819 type:complete len:85 (+) Transcript_35478:87-341(+)